METSEELQKDRTRGERGRERERDKCVCVLHKRAGGQSPGCWSSTLRHCLVDQATAAADVDMKVTITVLFVSCVPNLMQHKLCTVSLSLYLYFFPHPSICMCICRVCLRGSSMCILICLRVWVYSVFFIYLLCVCVCV